jgi:hypothetical protein
MFKEDNIFSLMSYVLWNITPCSPLEVNRYFRGTCRLHLQGRGVSQVRNQREVSFCWLHSYLCTILWSDTEVLKQWCVSYVGHGHEAVLDQLREVSVLNNIQIFVLNCMETDLLTTCFMLVSCCVCSSTLTMEVTCSFEASVYFQRTTRRYIPEDRSIHNHRCENLKFCIVLFVCFLFARRAEWGRRVYTSSSNLFNSVGLILVWDVHTKWYSVHFVLFGIGGIYREAYRFSQNRIAQKSSHML